MHKDIETTEKTDLEIKKASIIHAEDSIDLKDKSDEYVNAVFDTLVSKVKAKDDLAAALNDDDGKQVVDPNDKEEVARAKFIDNQRGAWKPKEEK